MYLKEGISRSPWETGRKSEMYMVQPSQTAPDSAVCPRIDQLHYIG
jgi:hypothetical protein